MSDTTKDLRVVASAANMYSHQQDGHNKATKAYYVGQAVIKDENGRLDGPGNAAYPVIGVFVEATEGTDAMAVSADDQFEFTLQTGEFLHFKNSGTNPIVAGTTKPGTPVFFEDNQTVGILASAGSWGGVFLGFDQGRLKIGVGPQYWDYPRAFTVTTAAVTDNSGGAAADGTIGVVTLPILASWDGAHDPTAAEATQIINAVTANRDAITELATKLNALIADLKS